MWADRAEKKYPAEMVIDLVCPDLRKTERTKPPEFSQKVRQTSGWRQKLTAIGTGWISVPIAFSRRKKTKL
jgi:hypothetical protein